MTKPGFFKDTFEKLVELGSSTGKKTIQAVRQTFSPLRLTEEIFGKTTDDANQSNEKKQHKDQSHTPLDFKRLNESYAKQDKQKEMALRNRLFQLVRQGEKQVLVEIKQNKEKEKIAEERKEEEKKRQAKIKKQEQEIPTGKIRRSIFSPKKVAQKQHQETKPAVGKQ